MGSPTGHTKPADPPLERGLARVDLGDAFSVGDRIFLDTEHALYGIADGKCSIVGFFDDACGAGAHNLAELHRCDIGSGIVHPAPHGRIERNARDPDAELARPGLGHRAVLNGEVCRRRHASRPTGEPNHAVAHIVPSRSNPARSHVLRTRASRVLCAPPPSRYHARDTYIPPPDWRFCCSKNCLSSGPAVAGGAISTRTNRAMRRRIAVFMALSMTRLGALWRSRIGPLGPAPAPDLSTYRAPRIGAPSLIAGCHCKPDPWP